MSRTDDDFYSALHVQALHTITALEARLKRAKALVAEIKVAIDESDLDGYSPSGDWFREASNFLKEN